MTAVASFPVKVRHAASPNARRLARESEIDLGDVGGSGPNGRIVVADILAHRVRIAAPAPQRPGPPPRVSILTFSAVVSLVALYRIAADAARVGLTIAIEDAASRAAREALGGAQGRIAVEADGRQVIIIAQSGQSIGAERRLRLNALASDVDVSKEPAAASLLVQHASRVVPAALPLLPGRALRFVLVVDRDAEEGQALLCADPDAVTEARAVALLVSFVDALEQPLALLV